jgi:quinol-cytochrome oxidoreductase complex cytochrome b subunit
MTTRLVRLGEWLEERLGWRAAQQLIQHKEVPLHRHSIWYYFGGMTLFLFAVQVCTGILLLLYYRPSAETAFESVQFIMTEVQFGWLVRSVHSWSANLMIATAFVHMFSALFLRAYRRPRKLTWVSGALLLFLSLAFGFSGYLLPWNKLAFFATKVGTDIAGVVPVIGPFLLRFLRGGDEVTGATLTRFFGFHVAILPATATILLSLHLYLVQKHGMSVPPSVDAEQVPKMRFVPDFFLRDLVGWLTAITVLAILAAVFPWELGEKADAFAPAPAGIKPEWYFVYMFQTLKYIPPKIIGIDGEVLGILFFGFLAIGLAAIPFMSRTQPERRFNLISAAGIVALAYILALSALAYLREKT